MYRYIKFPEGLYVYILDKSVRKIIFCRIQ